MRISIIVAAAENGIIGREGGLPWHLSADLRRFKRLTMGHTLLVGRRTWESIGRPLPGRRMMVLSRSGQPGIEGAEVFGDFDEAIESARQRGESELFVAGGGEIYRLALPYAQRIYLTRVHLAADGDVDFPELDPEGWSLTWEEEHQEEDPGFTFQIFERRSNRRSRNDVAEGTEE